MLRMNAQDHHRSRAFRKKKELLAEPLAEEVVPASFVRYKNIHACSGTIYNHDVQLLSCASLAPPASFAVGCNRLELRRAKD